MEARSLDTQAIQMELSPLNEGFVRTAVTINRMMRGDWEVTLESDYEAEVYRVQEELRKSNSFLTHGVGAVALIQEDTGYRAVGYGHAFANFDSVWFGSLGLIPEKQGLGIVPALAQVLLVASDKRSNRQVTDPHNVLPPLLAGALDGSDGSIMPKLPEQPYVADVQIALIESHPHLAQYDVKNT